MLYICDMNIFRILFELFLLYMLYKLVFDFIIPVARTTKQVKKQFSEMSSKMQEQMNQQQANANTYRDNHSSEKKTVSGDYIDFEEVK